MTQKGRTSPGKLKTATLDSVIASLLRRPQLAVSKTPRVQPIGGNNNDSSHNKHTDDWVSLSFRVSRQQPHIIIPYNQQSLC